MSIDRADPTTCHLRALAAQTARYNTPMAVSDPVRYPAEYETDVLLKDGSTVHLRPIRTTDGPAVAALFRRLSPRSLYLRFHHHLPGVSEKDIRRFTHVDYENQFGLAATLGEPPGERIIALGLYARIEGTPDRAEVAFTVEDSHQGRGIATQLLDRMAAIARDHGIDAFEADLLGENESMLEVFRDSGFPLESRIKYGTLHVAFPIEETEAAEERAEEREMVAAASSVRSFFQPRTVAVIGASRQRGTIGSEIFHALLRDGFTGVIYPVNPMADAVGAVKAYPSVLDVPDEIDLAIVAVPAAQVIEIADHCARKGVHSLVIISAGFAEAGADGAQRERALLAKARSYGMRLIGPNCMGVVNADPAVSLNGTFSPVFPPFGNVALLSQSGALGLALIDYCRKLNLGLSTFVSVGNRADVSANDLIQYWEQDPATDVILMHLETFGNPRKFARLARRISAKKPVIAVKSGRTAAGSRAAASRAGSLATIDAASEALFRQAGLIRTDTLEQLFDVASLLAHQPVPSGRRVAILTNGKGPGILAADACAGYGLELPPLGEQTVRSLGEFLPPEAGLTNPVYMTVFASAADYGRALRILLRDERVDSVLVIFTPPMVTQPEEVALAIRDAGLEARGRKTLLTCFMSAQGAPPELSSRGEYAVPSYAFPEAAAMALARVCQHAEWRKRPRGSLPRLDADAETARRIVEAALVGAQGGEAWLTPDACAGLLAAYGIRFAPGAAGGIEAIVGVTQDPSFGPLIMFGLGGTFVELLRDVAFRIHPLTDVDAREMVRSIRAYPLLEGWRGSPPGDVAAVEELLLRVSRMIEDLPEIAEMDLNPLRVLSPAQGCTVADARVLLRASAPQ